MRCFARSHSRLPVASGLALALLSTTTLSAPAAAQTSPATAASTAAQLTPLAAGVDVRSGNLLLRITALTDQIVRVRIGRGGTLPEDASWAVPSDVRRSSIKVTPEASGFATAALRVRVDPATLGLSIEDLDGRIISADAANPFEMAGSSFALRKQLPVEEHIFGLGDKTGGLDRREHSFVDWNTDAFAFTSSTDPIYKSIPFFIGVGGAGGSYGLLFDNSWRTWFDFGHREADVMSFGGPDGPIDYYVIAGPSTSDVVRRYTDLTGKAPLPPQWAFGYQQSRYSYMNEAEVRDVAARLRAEKIPTDVIWLDIDFQDRNRPFTVNREAFPNLKGLTQDLGRDGIKLVTITDLHVAMAPGDGYAPYESGTAGNHFVHNPDGSVYVGKVWPGPSVFPDFSRSATRDWWGGQMKGLVDAGVAGFWNDMNEPSVFETPSKTMPVDAVHRIESDDFGDRDATHAELHNVYGLLNTRATYEGQARLQPGERPFVMTRATYAGGQRYAVTWTGDNSSTWDHLKLSVHQIINLGLSGFSYAAADVGGFTGGPSADLLTRWFEIGAFTPIFRDHAMKGTPRAEPWVDGPEHLAIRKRFVDERYRLLPYFYALSDQNHRLGDPIMRPVFYDYPDTLYASCDQSMAFTVGRSLLVAAPPKPESPQSYDVCLPAGGWYDYWTGLPVGAGTTAPPEQALASAVQTIQRREFAGERITETPRLDHLPVFVRAGTILPRQPVVQSTAERPKGPLALDVYPGGNCGGALYADDGRADVDKRGQFLRQSIRCTSGPDGVRIDFDARAGRFTPWWKDISVTLHGWDGAATVRQRGKSLAVRTDGTSRTISFTIADPKRPASITISKGAGAAVRSSSNARRSTPEA